jgi:hypothetical protein
VATNSIAARAARTSAGVLPAAIAVIMVIVLALALAAMVSSGQSAAPAGSLGWTERYAPLAGMGGLPNPGPRVTESGSHGNLAGSNGNLAGMGGLPNPAPRD